MKHLWCHAVVIVTVLAMWRSSRAETYGERELQSCLRKGQKAVEKLEKLEKGKSPDNAFTEYNAFERTCIKGGAKEMKELPGYAEVLKLFAKAEKLAVELDAQEKQCVNDEYKTACSEMRPIHSKYCENARHQASTDDYSLNWKDTKELDTFVSTVKALPETLKRVEQFRSKWSKCDDRENRSCNFTLADCKDATAALMKTFQNTVDKMLSRKWIESATESLAKKETSQASHFASEGKQAIEPLLATIAKLPKNFAYKKADLDAMLVKADQIVKEVEKIDQREIASRKCPPGQTLSATHKRLVAEEFTEAKIIRATGGKKTWRAGLISKEGIPVAVCGVQRGSGGKICRSWEITVFREKPPGGVWTSWALSIGGDYQINCAKMK